MRKTELIVSIIVWIVGGAIHHPANTTAQQIQKHNPLSGPPIDRLELAPVHERLNDLERDTTYWVKLNTPYHFATFHTDVYTGKLADPHFTGHPLAKDSAFVDFITAGCKDHGINFGGQYTILHKSCGCMCEHLWVVDRISGEIFVDINLITSEDGDGKWGYLYTSDSNMLIANSNLFTTDLLNCYTAVYKTSPEFYSWTGKKFKRIQ